MQARVGTAACTIFDFVSAPRWTRGHGSERPSPPRRCPPWLKRWRRRTDLKQQDGVVGSRCGQSGSDACKLTAVQVVLGNVPSAKQRPRRAPQLLKRPAGGCRHEALTTSQQDQLWWRPTSKDVLPHTARQRRRHECAKQNSALRRLCGRSRRLWRRRLVPLTDGQRRGRRMFRRRV